MKKLKLQVEVLAVESFPTTNIEGQMGTVHGEALAITVPPQATCQWSRTTECSYCTPLA